jgi:xylulokinase
MVLAIDLGSSWCKVAYLDRNGRAHSEGRAYTRAIAPARDGSLESFWDAVVSAVRSASSPAGQPAAIAISCRGLFGACLDKAGQAFWPAWNYGSIKTSDEVREVYESPVWAGKDPYAHGYAARLAGLVLWLKRSDPDEWARITRVGALHDYIVYRLTGRWVTDPTTGPEQMTWPSEILDLTGLPECAFPEIIEPQQIVSGLTDGAACDLSLQSGIPVVCGFHDGAAANRGTGTVNPGDACFTLGTNFVLRAVTGERLQTGCFCYTVAPGMWSWVNNVPQAATQLDVMAGILSGNQEDLVAAHQRLGARSLATRAGSDGARIVLAPVETTTSLHLQVATLRRDGHSDDAIYRAMLESIAFGVRGLIHRAMRDGASPQRFVATGGSSRNTAFLKVLGSVIGAPIEIGEPEAGMVGAGMAAAVGAGWYATLDDAMTSMRTPGPMVHPDSEAASFYRVHLEGATPV